MLIRLQQGWVDLNLQRFEVADRRGKLTTREAELLRYMHERPGPCTREQLLEEVFDYNPQVQTRALDVAVTRLRKKIEVSPSAPAHLLTVPTVGYQLVTQRRDDRASHFDLSKMMRRARSPGARWESQNPEAKRTLAVLSLFQLPVSKEVVQAILGAEAASRMEALERDLLLREVDDGYVLSHRARPRAEEELTPADVDLVGSWAFQLAEAVLTRDSATPDATITALGPDLFELAASRPPAEAVTVQSAVLLTEDARLEQLEALHREARSSPPLVRARAMRALLSHPITGRVHWRRWCVELEGLLDDLDGDDQIVAFLVLARCMRLDASADRARAFAQRATDALRSESPPLLATWAWLLQASTFVGVERVTAYREAARFARLAASPTHMALALSGLATSAPAVDGETLHLLGLAADLVPNGNREMRAQVLTDLARVALLDDVEEATRLGAQALIAARAGTRPARLATALVLQADLARVQGAFDDALDLLRAAVEAVGDSTGLQFRRAALLADLGRVEEARRLLQDPPHHDQRLLRVDAEAAVTLAVDGAEAARAVCQRIDSEGLAQHVQEQCEIPVLLHRGLWQPPSA